MKVIGIVAQMLVIMGAALTLACSAEKAASIEGHEGIVAVLQKIPQSLEDPSIVHEIYTENAISNSQNPDGGITRATGLKEIESRHRESCRNWRMIELSIDNIEKEADIAHVTYSYKVQDRPFKAETHKHVCSAEMQKMGDTWKIKEVNSQFRY